MSLLLALQILHYNVFKKYIEEHEDKAHDVAQE